MPKESSGGSTETEVSEVAVKPTGASAAAVITATPAACRRKTERSRPGASAGEGAGRGSRGAPRSGVAVMEVSFCRGGRRRVVRAQRSGQRALELRPRSTSRGRTEGVLAAYVRVTTHGAMVKTARMEGPSPPPGRGSLRPPRRGRR